MDRDEQLVVALRSIVELADFGIRNCEVAHLDASDLLRIKFRAIATLKAVGEPLT